MMLVILAEFLVSAFIVLVVAYILYRVISGAIHDHKDRVESRRFATEVMEFDEAKQIMLKHVAILTQGGTDFEEAVLTVLSDRYMPCVGSVPTPLLVATPKLQLTEGEKP